MDMVLADLLSRSGKADIILRKDIGKSPIRGMWNQYRDEGLHTGKKSQKSKGRQSEGIWKNRGGVEGCPRPDFRMRIAV
jgi:hypothetical protein